VLPRSCPRLERLELNVKHGTWGGCLRLDFQGLGNTAQDRISSMQQHLAALASSSIALGMLAPSAWASTTLLTAASMGTAIRPTDTYMGIHRFLVLGHLLRVTSLQQLEVASFPAAPDSVPAAAQADALSAVAALTRLTSLSAPAHAAHDSPAQQALWVALGSLSQLQDLSVTAGTESTFALPRSWSQLASLSRLSFTPQLTVSGIRHISRLPALRSLSVSVTPPEMLAIGTIAGLTSLHVTITGQPAEPPAASAPAWAASVRDLGLTYDTGREEPYLGLTYVRGGEEPYLGLLDHAKALTALRLGARSLSVLGMELLASLQGLHKLELVQPEVTPELCWCVLLSWHLGVP
jgi:hypothetical protein